MDGIEVTGDVSPPAQRIATPEALEFVARLHREFEPTRHELLRRRAERQAQLSAGERPDFLAATQPIRKKEWRVAPAPADLADRRVEITGPTDRKMVINALNSGARVFMADFEDANTPSWSNMVEGQANLADAVAGTIAFTSPDGREYALGPERATLVVRPRGWHLPERHVHVDGEPVAGALFDFGLYFFHNARALLEAGSGPYFYLAKLESHVEARLWNDVFDLAQDMLGVPRGTIRATVLVETILAAFEMEEILYELRTHAAGLNAGRWDYIFSIIKKFRDDPAMVLPDRNQVTMTVPFMRQYAQLLVRTCHARGAHAIGGMSAFVPNSRDPEMTEQAFARVREDKEREAGDGCDGTWVAHPGLVPVAKQVFDHVLGARPNQLDRQRGDVSPDAADLLDVRVPDGRITEAGVRSNVAVGLRYLESWLRGTGAVTIFNLMEDAATAEISRSQIWQWVRHGASLDDGRHVTAGVVREIIDDEMREIGDPPGNRFRDARVLFDEVALAEDFVEFLTLPAYSQVAS